MAPLSFYSCLVFATSLQRAEQTRPRARRSPFKIDGDSINRSKSEERRCGAVLSLSNCPASCTAASTMAGRHLSFIHSSIHSFNLLYDGSLSNVHTPETTSIPLDRTGAQPNHATVKDNVKLKRNARAIMLAETMIRSEFGSTTSGCRRQRWRQCPTT